MEYHFPNKEILLLAIYERMREEISVSYVIKDEQEPFEAFNTLLFHLEKFQDKYKFFNLDFLEIGRNHPKVGVLLSETAQNRKVQLTIFFERFQKEGYIQEGIKQGKYALLCHAVTMLILFWTAQQAILPSGIKSEENRLAKNVWALMFPILTKRGKDVYNNLNILVHE